MLLILQVGKTGSGNNHGQDPSFALDPSTLTSGLTGLPAAACLEQDLTNGRGTDIR
jgi:hypothetical protein